MEDEPGKAGDRERNGVRKEGGLRIRMERDRGRRKRGQRRKGG